MEQKRKKFTHLIDKAFEGPKAALAWRPELK